MPTYQDLLRNTISQAIYNLTNGPQPGMQPGSTAWTWFRSTDMAQPAEANDYVRSILVTGMKAVAMPAYGPADNWATWTSALNNNLSAATGNVRKWLDTLYVATALDTPTVPEDVITWTKGNLPTGAGVTVAVGARQPVKS